MRQAWVKTLTLASLALAVSAVSIGESYAQDSASDARLTAPLPRLDNPSKKYSGKWWLESQIDAIEGGLDQSLNGQFKARLDLDFNLGPFADFNIDGDLNLSSGFAQFRYRDDVADSGPRARDIYFRLHHRDQAEIRLGLLGQKDLESVLLINGRRAFAGVREGFKTTVGPATFSLFAQQTVPSSVTLNFYRTELEPTPWFMTETAQLNLNFNKSHELFLTATHYRFSRLPSRLAFDSAPEGNTVLDPNIPAATEFAFQFDGVQLGSHIQLFKDAPVCLILGGEIIQNNTAERGYNRGQVLYASSCVRIGRVMVNPMISTFFNESDTAPSVFNRFDFGNNNRKGERAEVKVNFLDYGFTLKVVYMNAEVIDRRQYLPQLDRQAFSVQVETAHVTF